jgi:hypothetical protein
LAAGATATGFGSKKLMARVPTAAARAEGSRLRLRKATADADVAEQVIRQVRQLPVHGAALVPAADDFGDRAAEPAEHPENGFLAGVTGHDLGVDRVDRPGAGIGGGRALHEVLRLHFLVPLGVRIVSASPALKMTGGGE